MHIAVNLNVSQLDILLSNYTKSLTENGMQSYLEKLKIKFLNSTVNLEDPYFIDSSKWSEDLTL